MKVAVIGAGIVGVTTAYELAADGHDVVVFERRGSVAAEASFAHGGLICASELAPWRVPGGLRRALGGVPMPWWPAPAPGAMALWAWPSRGRRAAQATALESQRQHILRLANFSRDRLRTLAQHLRLDHERADGHLMLLRTAQDLARAEPGLAALARLGTRFEQLDGARCRGIEPGLSAETALHAGIYFPDDEVGNCRQFAHLLRTAAARLGARFRFHTEVLALGAGPTPQLVHRARAPESAVTPGATGASAALEAGDTEPMPLAPITENFDAVVVCAALGAPALLAPHGLALPWQAVHGHSLTAPLRSNDMFPDQGPRAAVIDQRHRVSISRLGGRVRVVGSLMVHGSSDEPHDRAFAPLYKALHDWFPGAARMSHVQRWKSTFTLLQDGSPLLGTSGISGVWLNLGHGANGWALACGSARLLADAVSGRQPSIATTGFGLDRLPR